MTFFANTDLKIKSFFMKKIIFSLLASVIALTAWSQNQYTVNNNTNFAADFSDLQTAVDSVPSGSILIVQGSGISYGDVVVSKPLVLLGPGYNLVTNPEIYSQSDQLEANLNYVTFTASATGSLLSGLRVDNTLNANGCNSLSIRGNRFYRGIYLNNSGNVSISNNVIEFLSGSVPLITAYGSAGTIVKNNIFTGSNHNTFILLSYNTGSVAPPTVTAEFNTFIRHDSVSTVTQNSVNVNPGGTLNLKNNIFANLSTSPAAIDFAATVGITAVLNLQNNIFSDGSFFGSTGALNNVTPSSLFAHLGNTNIDIDYKLQNAIGSPAIGAGTGGSTIGAYGGATPYIPSGHVLIPNIYKLEVSPAGSNASGLNIHIKAKAN